MRFAPVFVTLVAAASALVLPRQESEDCNVEEQQCCNNVEDSSESPSPGLLAILTLLGLNISDLTGQIGITCIPIQLIGSAGDCTAIPVCCTNSNFSGLIAIGCTPINISV